MYIVDLRPDDEAAIRQVARLLVEDFATDFPGSWTDLDSALEEVRESFAAGRISRIAQDSDGTVLGWVGGISQYRGHVWELMTSLIRQLCPGSISFPRSGNTWATLGTRSAIPMSFTRSRAT